MAKMETIIDFHDPKFAPRPSDADNQQTSNQGEDEEEPPEAAPQSENTEFVEMKKD